MTVYLYCEGVTDYAVIPPLMKQITRQAGKTSDMNIKRFNAEKLKNEFKSHRKRAISGKYKFIKALAVLSIKNSVKHIAYHQDADGNYKEVFKAITTEFKELQEKSRFRCIAIVPKEMIESWLLADIKVINALGDGTVKVNQSPMPETLWGDKGDPNSDYPKNYLKRNLEQLGIENDSAAYATIAEKADIQILKKRCPLSFGQFYDDMKSFIAEENTPKN